MTNILFVALQCFECSTMQVKQKKKSSNKWVCVICNQKQSVRKVFAQGYKAKELRFFVQSFNMSRKAADEEEQAVAAKYLEVDNEGENYEEVSDIRGSDWSEYLDSGSPIDRRRLTGEEDGEEDLKIVTEMRNDMFKRPKLSKYSNAGGYSSSSVTGGGEEDKQECFKFKPSLSRRNIKKLDFRSDGLMTRKKDIEQRNLEPARVTRPASNWDAYLIDDEGEHLAAPRFSGKDALKNDDVGEWDRAIMDISSEYQIIDDEVHPDFM